MSPLPLNSAHACASLRLVSGSSSPRSSCGAVTSRADENDVELTHLAMPIPHHHRYDRARKNLARHASHIVTAFIAGTSWVPTIQLVGSSSGRYRQPMPDTGRQLA